MPVPVMQPATPIYLTVGVHTNNCYYANATNLPLGYGCTALPPGLSFNGALISGTPTVAGNYTAQVTAWNASGVSAPLTLRFFISNAPPTVTSPSKASGVVGVPFSYQIVATNSPTSYSWTNPGIGLTLNPVTGLITGTPTGGGTFGVTISATNVVGTGSKLLTISIAYAPPVITSLLTASFTKDSLALYTITATNSPTSFNASGLPPGMTRSGATLTGTPTVAGTYNVSISATNAGGTDTKTLVVTVAIAPPLISSPLNATATVGVPFSYQITATNGPTSFNALNMPFGLSVNPTTGLISGTVVAAGSSNITLQATNAGGTGSNTMFLAQMSAPPAITSPLTKAGVRNTPLSYQITATNTPTSFGVTGVLPPGTSLNPLNGFITGVPESTGVYSPSIAAYNAYGSDFRTLVITIAAIPPVISSSLSASGNQGAPFSYTILATNDPTSFSASGLPPGLTLDPVTGIISGTLQGQGTTNISISATNTDGTDTETLALYVAAAPVIVSSLSVSASLAEAFSYFIAATNNPTSFGGTGFPTGLSLNTSTGEISGTPTTPGPVTAVISATNVDGSDIKNLDFTVVVTDPPVITSVLSILNVQDVALSYFITATNSPTLYGAPSGLPVGLSLNTGTGEISGMISTPGIYNVPITAGNAGGFDTRTLTIEVSAALPVITSALSDSGQQGHPYTYTITATNSPIVFGATNLPPGLSIDTNTGVISGVPVLFGVYNVTISATNLGGTDYKVLELGLAPGIPAPTITSALTRNAIQNHAFSYQITTDVVPTSYGASGLPSGLSINTATGLISGTPTATGISNIILSATNATGTGNATLILNVVIDGPEITSSLLEAASQFTPFTYQIVATNSPTAYTAVGLPLGLSVNPSTGLVSGTPNGTAGVSYVLITATNAGGVDSKTLLITVAAFIPPPPVITSSLTASVLKNTPFTYTITGSNSPTAFTAVGLPAGLHVNSATGLIYGTPTTPAVSNVTITASNAGGTDTKTLVLTVTAPAIKTIWANGVLVSRRHAVTATATVIIKGTSGAREAEITLPTDESVEKPYPMNAPGGLFAGQHPPASSTTSTG